MSYECSERRELYVPRDLVFDAWTDEQHLPGWYVTADCTVQRLRLDPRPGGVWSLAWTDAGGDDFAETGNFDQLTRPADLCCSLRVSSSGAEACDTRLEVHLADLGGACRIELTHGGFTTEARRDAYALLWRRRLDGLLEFFSAI